jgi:periplasmic protein TonB
MRAVFSPSFPGTIRIGHIRWGTCLAIVLAVHIVAGLALAVWRTIDHETSLPPAIMIDLGSIPGAGIKAGGASPAARQKTPRPAAHPVAKATPHHVVVTRRPVEIHKPVEKPSLLAMTKVVTKTEAAATSTSGTAENVGGGTTAGASGAGQGSGGSSASGGNQVGFGTGGKPTWLGLLLAHLERFKRYPTEAQQEHHEGIVYLQFSMDRSGHVLSASLQQSSGYQALDQETLDLIQRAQPLPPPPPEVPQAQIDLVVPVQYQLPD